MCKLFLFYVLAFPENENVTPFNQAHFHPKRFTKKVLKPGNGHTGHASVGR